MKTHPFLHVLTALPFAVLLTSTSFAGPVRDTSVSREPRRIYDLESQNFIDNPDYHEPVPAVKAARTDARAQEPRRMYDAETGQYVANPDYREPTAVEVAANTRVQSHQSETRPHKKVISRHTAPAATSRRAA